MALQTDQGQAVLASRLAYFMGEDLRLCEQLLVCIRQETMLLREHAHDVFLREMANKDKILAALKTIETERETFLHQLGVVTISDAILACPAQAQSLNVLQNTLREVTETCVSENRRLGKLIHGQSRFFNFLLGNLLPGRHETLTYQPNGSRPPGSGVGKLISV